MRQAAAGLTLLALAGPASAQSLLPDAPLTTLLKPQPLDRSRPLLPQDSAAGARAPARTGPNGQPCVRPGVVAGGASSRGAAGNRPGGNQPGVPAKPSGGGGGPGEYARYLPGAAATAVGTPSAVTAGSAPDARAAGFDRPLYGGTSRPLWGAPAAGPGNAAKPSVPGSAAETSEATAVNPPTASGIPRDRPLWADGSDTGGSADLLPAPSCGSAPLVR